MVSINCSTSNRHFAQGRYWLFPAIILTAMLPSLASSCIITDNPCDCQLRGSLGCTPFGLHWLFIFLLGWGARVLFSLYLLAGFYWSLRDKTKKKVAIFLALKITASFIFFVFILNFVSDKYVEFLPGAFREYIIIRLILDMILLGLWWKKLVWYKAIGVLFSLALICYLWTYMIAFNSDVDAQTSQYTIENFDLFVLL